MKKILFMKSYYATKTLFHKTCAQIHWKPGWTLYEGHMNICGYPNIFPCLMLMCIWLNYKEYCKYIMRILKIKYLKLQYNFEGENVCICCKSPCHLPVWIEIWWLKVLSLFFESSLWVIGSYFFLWLFYLIT